MTSVVKVNHKQDNFTLYIGRAWAGLTESKWCNPFHLKPRRIGPNAWEDNLHEVLEKYEQYVRSRPDLMSSLHEIDDQILGCWCHEIPSDGSTMFCHGDVLIKLRKEQLAQSVL